MASRSNRRRSSAALIAIGLVVTSCSGTSSADAAPTTNDSTATTSTLTTSPVSVESEPTSTTVTVPTASTNPPNTTTTVARVLVPQLVGMSLAEATQLLESLGLEAPLVQERESFVENGIVLSQSPPANAVPAGIVELIVATSIAPMPDFIGMPIAEARAWANAREISVTVASQLTLEMIGGSVFDQVPPPGGEMGAEIVFTVAETPLVMRLPDLEAVDSDDFGIFELVLDGETFTGASYFDLGMNFVSNETGHVEYDLAGEWASFTLVIGVDDRNEVESSVLVEFSLDGELVRTEIVVFGASTPIELDVTDVTTLRIVATALAGGSDIDLGLAGAQLVADVAAGAS